MNNLGERFKSTLSLSKLLSNSHHCHNRTDTKHPAPLITQEENRFVCSVKIRWRLSLIKDTFLIRNLTTQYSVSIYIHTSERLKECWRGKKNDLHQFCTSNTIQKLARVRHRGKKKSENALPCISIYTPTPLSLNICTFCSTTTWNWNGLD